MRLIRGNHQTPRLATVSCHERLRAVQRQVGSGRRAATVAVAASQLLERKSGSRCLVPFTDQPHTIAQRAKVVRQRLDTLVHPAVVRVCPVSDRIKTGKQTLPQR